MGQQMMTDDQARQTDRRAWNTHHFISPSLSMHIASFSLSFHTYILINNLKTRLLVQWFVFHMFHFLVFALPKRHRMNEIKGPESEEAADNSKGTSVSLSASYCHKSLDSHVDTSQLLISIVHWAWIVFGVTGNSELIAWRLKSLSEWVAFVTSWPRQIKHVVERVENNEDEQ